MRKPVRLQLSTPRKLHTKSNEQACPAARPHYLRPHDRNHRFLRDNCLPVSMIPIPLTDMPTHPHRSDVVFSPTMAHPSP